MGAQLVKHALNEWRYLGDLFGHVALGRRDGRATLTACGLMAGDVTQNRDAVTCEKCAKRTA
jgi:hypothetical protein